MDFVTSGPVLSLELMGVNSVKKWRHLLGKDSFSLKKSCMYESVTEFRIHACHQAKFIFEIIIN